MATAGPSTLFRNDHSDHARMSTTGSSFRAPSGRCSQCNPRQKENTRTRNIVVCIDGTSNMFGHFNTNVVKLFAKIDLETTSGQPEQFAYYSSGVGTGPKSSLHIFDLARAFSDKFDMAIAWNVEEIVKDAYGWLARTYREGDQIYLFGFSRGAYQVRVLAGMIHEVGLIRTPTEKQIGTAYEHYEAIRSGKPKTRQIAREFKNTFSWKGLRIHFVGVWDTVSSVGLIRGDVFLSTSSSAAHACHFRHALALDELRVKFMPEYFHEMNSQMYDVESKHVVTSPEAVHAASPVSEWRDSAASDDSSGSSKEKKTKTTEIKEVWFAGSHSDVGGRNIPGKSHQAGNVSLLWMRREAATNGLVFRPTDVVWVPDDIDFGVNSSMKGLWRIIEQVPIKHQVSFSGAGEDDRRRHRQQPRRIIPGQKVHASILYANAYDPYATPGEGFSIPTLHTELEDTELDNEFWETGLFDDTAAHELVTYCSQQGVAPVYLNRLLFMLRFKEGRQCVRRVPDWQKNFLKLIRDENCAILVRLVTIVIYYEAFNDPEAHPESPVQPDTELPQNIFDDMKIWLDSILTLAKHQLDVPIVVALMRPLARHQILREHVLTPDVLEALVKCVTVTQPGANFGQAMDGLNCLLRYEDIRQTVIKGLGIHDPNLQTSRLSAVLQVNDSHLLVAVLRMVLTLARISGPEARRVCNDVKPRLRQLARTTKGSVGLLATEILLAIYDPNDPRHLDVRNARFRANIAGVLVRLNLDRHDSPDGQNGGVDAGQQILRRIFGLDAEQLTADHQGLIRELKKAVRDGNARERSAATLTLLKLCKSKVIRDHLRAINMLDIFVDQLQRRDSALLAAYALAACLKYSNGTQGGNTQGEGTQEDMKEALMANELFPKHIVGMLRLDYFDDAVNRVEGFQIFREFMQYEELRDKINEYNISLVLNEKLGKGEQKEIRTSLICLDIFRSFDPNGPWTDNLVRDSLTKLRNAEWEVQTQGIAILSALAQTEHGVRAISSRIPDIIKMLLPAGYLPISSEDETGPDVRSNSWMMGPAYALRILAQNKILRDCARGSLYYGSLKHLYLSGALVDNSDTPAWRLWTPNRADVTSTFENMIKAIDEELSEEGLMSIGDTVLPQIQHWNRLVTLVRDRTMKTAAVLPAVVGIPTLTILAAVTVGPVYLSAQTYGFLKRQLLSYLNTRALNGRLGNALGVLSRRSQGQEGVGESGHDESAGGAGATSAQGSEVHGTPSSQE